MIWVIIVAIAVAFGRPLEALLYAVIGLSSQPRRPGPGIRRTLASPASRHELALARSRGRQLRLVKGDKSDGQNAVISPAVALFDSESGATLGLHDRPCGCARRS